MPLSDSGLTGNNRIFQKDSVSAHKARTSQSWLQVNFRDLSLLKIDRLELQTLTHWIIDRGVL